MTKISVVAHTCHFMLNLLQQDQYENVFETVIVCLRIQMLMASGRSSFFQNPVDALDMAGIFLNFAKFSVIFG